VAVLDAALELLSEHRDELRELDAAVGDGDLGITADRGAAAVRDAWQDSPPGDLGTLLRTAGAAFAKANPSTMAALVGAGLLASAKEVGAETELTPAVTLRIGRSVAQRISERGKAQVGDKTVLDALVPSLDALEAGTPGTLLDAMVAAAQQGIEATTGQAGRKGRAAWVGERGIGHADPGAMLYLLFLRCLQRSAAAQTAPP
jgi:dihydroxyacetone kinase